MKETIHLRASELDRFFICNKYKELPQYNISNKFSTYGTKWHEEVLSELLDHHPRSDDSCILYEHLKKHFTPKQISHLKVEKFRTKVIENESIKIVLSGTYDLRVGNTIIDLKSGYIEVDILTNQLMAYAYLNRVKKVGIYQNHQLELFKYQPSFFEDFEQKLLEVAQISTHQKGDHCNYCPSKLWCDKFQYSQDDVLNFEKSIKFLTNL